MSETNSFYQPEYEVRSISVQIAKIVDPIPGQDYVNRWQRSWTIDHIVEIEGYFNTSATSVYIDTDA